MDVSSQIANMILNQAKQTGADPYTLLASAIVESSLDPNAVGDNGTSYGLWQMHVGGAGGGSHGEARRYLDPATAVENRARHFRGGSGGAFAASVQRPADAAGYAKKVDAVIAQLRSGKLPYGRANLNAPVRSGAATGGSRGTPGGDGRKAAALNLIFDGDPMFAMAASRGDDVGSDPMPAPQKFSGGSKNVPARREGETGQQYLDRVLMAKFGLKHDPGNSQTTSGRHSVNSYHYRGGGQATDFGNARNSEEQLDAAKAYVDRNAAALGIAESLDEGDHRHFATLRAIRGGKRAKR